MRPLPRVLAFADDRIAALDDLGVRAAAIAAAGPVVGLVARLPNGTADRLAALAQRFVALAAPPMASVFVTGRTDVARATGAQGVILRKGDCCHPERSNRGAVAQSKDLGLQLEATNLRAEPGSFDFAPSGRYAQDDMHVLRSIHSLAEAESAIADGTDALIVGSIWPTSTHPGRVASGTGLLREVVALGTPTFAIGGATPARAIEARDAGAWGVASISALWDADDSYIATMEMLRPWS